MAAYASYKEEECFIVYWKIKNFSYYFNGKITSPAFNFSVYRHWFYLTYDGQFMKCGLERNSSDPRFTFTRQISFLTCDGSPEECISGFPGTELIVPKDVIFGNRRNAFLSDDTLTVRLRYQSNKRGHIFIHSQIGVKFKNFMWTLKEFCKNESPLQKSVEIAEFYGDIKLILKQNDGTDKQLNFEVTRNGDEKCYYTLKMSVLDSEGKALEEICDEYVFRAENGPQVRVCPLFFKMKELLACEKIALSGDALSLKCDFAISLGKLEDQTVYSYCESDTLVVKELENDITNTFKEKTYSVFATELQSDLKSILDSGTLGDVSLKIDTEVIKVHKVILTARSPVFKAMFTKDMQETINNTVVIEDLDLETVRGLILYMYTDTISDCHCGKIRKLYFAADKYQVLTLKNKCRSLLKTNLSISNICEVLILADLHQDENLKRATFEFIYKYDTQIFTLDTWKELKESHSKLALEVMCEIWSKIKK